MSLYADAFEPCQMLHKVTSDDVLGGDKTVWVTGATFDAAIVFNTSVEQIAGKSMVVKSGYTVTTHIDKVLEYHEVFRRLRDGKIFRVTSDGDDRFTPEAATFELRQVDAEEYTPAGSFAVPATPLTPAEPIEVQP